MPTPTTDPSPGPSTGLTFTLDLEDHRPDGTGPARFPAIVEVLLGRLERVGVRGTFFVVGNLGESHPELVRTVAAAGHEIALHDGNHTQLDASDPETLRATATKGRDLLADVTGTEIRGYRAATFSLVRSTTWATDVLAEVGFDYSSSVLAAPSPLYGYPEAPSSPFRWPSGLLEIPAPLVDFGVTKLPVGGTYLRLLPVDLLRRRLEQHEASWIYCHPYDFDPDEPFFWEPVAGVLSPLLWVGRGRLWSKIETLLDPDVPPLVERIEALGEVPVFDPRSAGSQFEMVHELPPARCVERTEHLVELARNRSVIHVGFVDQGYRGMQDRAGAWLHAHLDESARSLVGLDLDADGVEAARAAGFDAHAVDCRDAEAVAAAGVQPAELVIAGEVIEHLDAPGPFLDGLHHLLTADGRLVITTPNAAGLLNTVAALVNREVNHPDHVVGFTWRTLTRLLADHGFEVERSATFVSTVKESGLLATGARALTTVERVLSRLGRPFVADGLIVVCRSVRSGV